jgi:hypothetical protein
MSPDVILKVIGYAVAPLVMALLGSNLAAESVTDPGKRRMYRGVFYLLAAIGIGFTWVVEWRADKSHENELSRNSQETSHTQALLVATQVQSAKDMGYLRGRLDAMSDRPVMDMQKLAEAITAASAAIVKAQVRTQSDTDLKSQAGQLAREMRTFESTYRTRIDTSYSNRAYSPTMTEAEKSSLFQQQTASLLQAMQQEQLEFRERYLTRAITLRDELIAKLGKTALPETPNYRLIAFDGILAGPTPIADAADYLEMLAAKLPEQANKVH